MYGDIDCNVPRRLAIFSILERVTGSDFVLNCIMGLFLLLAITVKPRYNEPLYNEDLGITNDFQILICNELLFLFPFFQPLKKVCLQTKLLGILFKYILFCFILLFTSSSPCREDQFAVLYFSSSLIVLIQVYNWEIRHHSLVCCCGFADILKIFFTQVILMKKNLGITKPL